MASSSSSSSRSKEESSGVKRWNKFKNHWTKTLYTPFLVSLTAGNIDIDTFQDFLGQNVHFLRAFAQAYEMAEKYTDDEEAAVLIGKMRESVLREIKMHASPPQVPGERGVALPGESIPCSATVKYTEFLLATASGKIHGLPPGKFGTPFEKTKLPAYTFGAMAPLMRLYTFLGKELQTLEGAREGVGPIQKWINQCSSKKFHDATVQTETLLDQLSVAFTGDELNIIENLYGQAIDLETKFFAAHTPVQRTVVPLSRQHNSDEHRLLLFSDFDLTCTHLDLSAILAELAIIAPKSEESQSEDQSESQIVRMSSADLKRRCKEFSAKYTEEYEKCLETILVPNKAKIFDYEGLCKALEQVSEFDKQANTRVIYSDVLKGLSYDDIKLAGERLILQDGCTNFFQSIVNNEKLNTRIHIVSEYWCDDLIKPCFASGGLGSVSIHANQFDYKDSLSTGEILKKVDKVQAFKNILGDYPDDGKNLTVCIGDSVDDLLCLLKADVGIVIGSSSESLKTLANQFGVSLIPLLQGVIKKQKSTEESSSDWKGSLSGVLYTASSWTEIHSFVLGL